jgi:histone demethylase JARID1
MDAPASTKQTVVEYGDNIEGSAFKRSAKTKWNLQTLPEDADSALKHLQHVIPGVNGPMMYHGMVFSTFCWHVEDLNLNSINYHHAGAAKIWYGVAGRHADAFEKVVRDKVGSNDNAYVPCAAQAADMIAPHVYRACNIIFYVSDCPRLSRVSVICKSRALKT